MQIERQPIKTDYKYNQIGTFKELIIGAGTKVFKANSSGVFAGSSSYSNAPFKLSYSGALIATNADISGNITATSGTFTGTIHAQAGDISGDLLVSGSLYSDNSGWRTQLIDGQLKFKKNSTDNSYIRAASAGNGLQLASKDNIFFTNMAGTPFVTFGSNGSIQVNSDSYIRWASGRSISASGSRITIDGDFGFSGNASINWPSGRQINGFGDRINVNGDFETSGSCFADGNKNRDLGRTDRYWQNIRGQFLIASDLIEVGGRQGTSTGGYGFLNGIRWKSGTLQARYAEIKVQGGIVYGFNEGSYFDV